MEGVQYLSSFPLGKGAKKAKAGRSAGVLCPGQPEQAPAVLVTSATFLSAQCLLFSLVFFIIFLLLKCQFADCFWARWHAQLSLFPQSLMSLITWAEANSPALTAHHRHPLSLQGQRIQWWPVFTKALIVPWAASTDLLLAIFILCLGLQKRWEQLFMPFVAEMICLQGSCGLGVVDKALQMFRADVQSMQPLC